MNRNTKQKMKWGAALVALVLAVPVFAMAETAAQTPALAAQTATAADSTASTATRAQPMDHGRCGFGLGGYGLNISSLTDKQKAAYLSAVALYEQVEDKVLQDLVTAGVVTQADVDAYATLRANVKSLAELDQSAWTADQYKAFYEANEKTGDKRTAAMQALVTAGQLTQAQADALSARGQDNLWTKISKNAGTSPAIQSAIQTMRQARKTLVSSLSTAGIQGKGGMFGGFGKGPKDFDQGKNKNGNSDMRDGKGEGNPS